MLSFESKKGVRFCDGLTRRDFLRVGSLTAGSVGLSLADAARLRASSNRDVNCILLFLVGAPSHLDTWDMKPSAPANIRGPFRPISTNVNGIQICEHLPRMARLADKYAIIRSVHHKMGNHNAAACTGLTGWMPARDDINLRDSPDQMPAYGSVVTLCSG